MAVISESVCVRATSGQGPILYVQPMHIHQRIPVLMGSAEEVDILVLYHS